MGKIKTFFALFVILYGSAAWSISIGELSKKTDVSRLEFVMLKIDFELKERLRNSDSILGFNRTLYLPEPEVDYILESFDKENELLITLILNEELFCGRVEPQFDDQTIKSLVALRMDMIARELMMFFDHFGEYEQKNIYDQNIVHYRVGQLFGFDVFRVLSEEDLESSRSISEQIKFSIMTQYCKKEERYPRLLGYSYPLNSNYDEFNADDGNMFPAKREFDP